MDTTITVGKAELSLVKFRGLQLFGHGPRIVHEVDEKLNISDWDAGWDTGLVTNVDEAIADADGQVVTSSFTGNSVIFDLDDTLIITDEDTVQTVTITVRANATLVDPVDNVWMDVSLLVGGVSQGTEQQLWTGSSPAYVNYVMTNAGWDADWTTAQINSMQVKVLHDSLGFSTPDARVSIDCIDVDIVFTSLVGNVVEPATAFLSVARKTPTVSIANDFQIVIPAAGSLTLTGAEPVPGLALGAIPAGSLGITGYESFINSQSLILHPNDYSGDWFGPVTNIDEDVAAADGQVVTGPETTTLTLEIDDVTGTLLATDTVIGVSMLLRSQIAFPGPDNIPDLAELLVTLVIDGSPLSTVIVDHISAPGEFINTPISDPSWAGAWTLTQLDGMQVTVLPNTSSESDVAIAYIDALDVIVEYAGQTPATSQPAVTDLDLLGYAPTLLSPLTIEPGAETLALAGKTPLVGRVDAVQPSEDALALTGKLPKRIVNLIPLPTTGAAVLAGKAPQIIVNHIPLPAIDDLVLAGQAPTIDALASYVALPAVKNLTLAPEGPLVQTSAALTIGPLRLQLTLAGQAPTIAVTGSVWSTPDEGTLVITGYAPGSEGSILRLPAIGTLTLTVLTPARVPGLIALPGAGSLTIAITLAGIAPLEAPLVLAPGTPTALLNHIAENAEIFDPQVIITGHVPLALVGRKIPGAAALTLATHVPESNLTTFLGVDPRLISLTVEHRIEFIATPSDILLD